MMKTATASILASVLLVGLSLASLAAQPHKPAGVLEGRDGPILLKRMVVTATPLPR